MAKVIVAAHTLFVMALTLLIWNAGSHMYKRQRIESLEDQLEMQSEASRTINSVIFNKEEGIGELKAVRVQVTSYNPVASQGWGNGLKTADGKFASPNCIAVSHDLKARYNLKFGSKVILKGYGVFTVTDLMNRRFSNRVDIISLVPQWSKAFGIRQAVLYIPKRRTT